MGRTSLPSQVRLPSRWVIFDGKILIRFCPPVERTSHVMSFSVISHGVFGSLLYTVNGNGHTFNGNGPFYWVGVLALCKVFTLQRGSIFFRMVKAVMAV